MLPHSGQDTWNAPLDHSRSHALQCNLKSLSPTLEQKLEYNTLEKTRDKESISPLSDCKSALCKLNKVSAAMNLKLTVY